MAGDDGPAPVPAPYPALGSSPSSGLRQLSLSNAGRAVRMEMPIAVSDPAERKASSGKTMRAKCSLGPRAFVAALHDYSGTFRSNDPSNKSVKQDSGAHN